MSSVSVFLFRANLSKVDKILGFIFFFQGKKRLRRIQNGFFPLLWLNFLLDGMFTTAVYSHRRGRFVNSPFPNKKNFAKNRSLFMTNKNESKCLHKFYISSESGKECYRRTTAHLEQPNCHHSQHFM